MLCMGTALDRGTIGDRVVEILTEALEDSSMSQRALVRASGVKLTRLGDILRRGKAVTVRELDDIAAALGLEGWQVMRDAEESAACHLQVGDDLLREVYGLTPPADIDRLAAQDGDVECEQEESQETP